SRFLTYPLSLHDALPISADLLDFVFSCGQAVLPDNIGLWLERLEHDIIPVGSQPLKDFLFRVFFAEPISPYRFFTAFRRNRSIRSEEHTSELQSRFDLVC